MATKCYAMVRGSAIRVTELTHRGGLTDPSRMAVSKSVIKVTIDEFADEKTTEVLRNDDDDPRIRLNGQTDALGYTVSADFLRVDPGLLTLMTGQPVVTSADGTVVGFDARRVPAQSFALEVWSKLAGSVCDGSVQRYGYTLFPFLKGGTVSGFKFGDGLVSFNVTGSRTRREPQWSVGPYDMEGWHHRLLEPVSRNTAFRTLITPAAPPEEQCGAVEFSDCILGGSATATSPDSLTSGSATSVGPWIVNGGRA